jgi:threonine/homoserine/homoserine lactone efflux protein
MFSEAAALAEETLTVSLSLVPESLSPALTGLGLGIALAGAPGPVQAVLLSEVLRGGPSRGFRAMAGANLTLGILLVALALGVSLAAPSGPPLRVLQVVGGLFLAYLGVDGLRQVPAGLSSSEQPSSLDPGQRAGLPPAARGALAVLLNPPAWLFLATAGSSLVAAATEVGGRPTALIAALGLLVGVAAGDFTLVLAGGLGLRRAGADIGRLVRRVLAAILVVLGLSLVLSGVFA